MITERQVSLEFIENSFDFTEKNGIAPEDTLYLDGIIFRRKGIEGKPYRHTSLYPIGAEREVDILEAATKWETMNALVGWYGFISDAATIEYMYNGEVVAISLEGQRPEIKLLEV